MRLGQSSGSDTDRPLRLLLVEDSDDGAGLLNCRLQKAGIAFQLQRVETEESFRCALKNPCDLIIFDFTLLLFDVSRALNILKSQKLDIPLIIISGTNNEDTAIAAMQHGAIDYLLQDRFARLPQAVTQGIEIARMRIRLRTKREELALARSHLEKLTIQFIDAQEQERMSLARELHDELGQRLAVLKINLHRMRSFLNEQDALDVWKYADTEVALLIAQIRAISVSLRPPALDYLGLESAIRQLLERQFVNAGTSYIFEYAGLPARLAPSIEITVYRIIQESITNIVRHANATRVVVEINGGATGDELELIVRDNGSGFDAGTNMTAQPGGASSGLLGMRERVELLGGIFNVETSKVQGTCVVASFLLKKSKHKR